MRSNQVEVGVAVEREAVQRHALRDADADGGDLAVGTAVVGRAPRRRCGPRPALRGDAELGADVDQHALHAADVGDDVDRVGQPHDRVADELPGAVPGDLAAAVDVDDRACRRRAAPRPRCACRRCRPAGARAAGRCPGPGAGDDLGVDLALAGPRLLVGHHAGPHDAQLAHDVERTRAGVVTPGCRTSEGWTQRHATPSMAGRRPRCGTSQVGVARQGRLGVKPGRDRRCTSVRFRLPRRYRMTKVDAAPQQPDAAPRRPPFLFVLGALALILFLVGLGGNSFQSKSQDVQKNDNSEYLPGVGRLDQGATTRRRSSTARRRSPGFVVYQRAGGLTAAGQGQDRSPTPRSTARARSSSSPSDNVGAAAVQQGRHRRRRSRCRWSARPATRIRRVPTWSTPRRPCSSTPASNAPPGLTVRSAGAGGLLVAFIDAFSGLDGSLLLRRR